MNCGKNLFFGKWTTGLIVAGLCSTSALAEPGILPSEIIIGQSAAFTGTPAEEVKQATAGAQLYFEHVNKNGGVAGRKIRLESLDDGFDPKRTVENTTKLLNVKNAFALFLYR
jgi:ABC-type branched-subunit amino acid transport system substrate-binding protein